MSSKAKGVITLIVVGKQGPTDEHRLKLDQGVFIGRSGNCGMQLAGEGLSDIHCRVGFEDGALWIQDWMSRDGTLVNGNKIDTKVPLKVGDVIQVGQHQIAVDGDPSLTANAPPAQPEVVLDDEPVDQPATATPAAPSEQQAASSDPKRSKKSLLNSLKASLKETPASPPERPPAREPEKPQERAPVQRRPQPDPEAMEEDRLMDRLKQEIAASRSNAQARESKQSEDSIYQPNEQAPTDGSADFETPTESAPDFGSADIGSSGLDSLADDDSQLEDDFGNTDLESADFAASGLPTDFATPDSSSSSFAASFKDEPVAKDAAKEIGYEFSGGMGTSLEFGFDDGFDGEDVTYDRETVALLEAEIEDLRSQLAQRDSERNAQADPNDEPIRHPEEASDEILARMKELIDEANRSDERAGILEEALLAAEDANQREQEERAQLEAWVGDIEKRIGQREDEHAAEIDAMRQRLDKAMQQQEKLQRGLQQAASGGGQDSAADQYKEMLQNLQQRNKELEAQLAAETKKNKVVEKKLEQQAARKEPELREERAKLANEKAKVSRMRSEITEKVAAIEELPKSNNPNEKETARRIQSLREHLRTLHEEEKREEEDAPITSRLSKLWKRVDDEY